MEHLTLLMSKQPVPPKVPKPRSTDTSFALPLSKFSSRKNQSSDGDHIPGATVVQLMEQERQERKSLNDEMKLLRAENERLKLALHEANVNQEKWRDAYNAVHEESTGEHRKYLGVLHALRSEVSGLRMDLYGHRASNLFVSH